jgi:hypothetical protein
LNKNTSPNLPLPDKSIPASVMLIGIFEVAIALLGLILVVLIGQNNLYTLGFLVLLGIYGAMGAGLMAIQEWARVTNVILHFVAIPYSLYAVAFLGVPFTWQVASQIVISCAIVFALTRPAIQFKFQTVVPKKKHH